MKKCNENKEASFLKYCYVNYLCGRAIFQKLPVNSFQCIKDTSQFYERFHEIYNEQSDERYFPELDVQYPEQIHEFRNDLQFLPEIMKIEKVKNLVINSIDKTEYVIHIKNLKQALNHGLVFKNIQSDQF